MLEPRRIAVGGSRWHAEGALTREIGEPFRVGRVARHPPTPTCCVRPGHACLVDSVASCPFRVTVAGSERGPDIGPGRTRAYDVEPSGDHDRRSWAAVGTQIECFPARHLDSADGERVLAIAAVVDEQRGVGDPDGIGNGLLGPRKGVPVPLLQKVALRNVVLLQ
jgi:hypothetical protein